jgi:hypothetical protein
MSADVPGADPRAAATVRAALREARFERDAIQELLGVSGDVLARRTQRPVYLRRLAGEGALETLVRIFLLDSPVDAATAERALGTDVLEALAALALVRAGDEVRSAVRLVPHGDILLASDLPERESAPDHVPGLHRPSATLADLTVRRPVERALDMGTGLGIQALLAARHAERVVATDLNERALAFAALNCALNGVENVELRHGSFFEPVAGETFGLVVSNPPYVISPESEFLFRDSGLGRDRVSEQLVGELPGFLEEGAFGTIMASWVQEGDDPAARPRGWLEGSGCAAWILHTGVEDALTTAANWNSDRAGDDAAYGEAIDRWVEYFRAEGIEAVAYGAILLRRGPPEWVRAAELPNEPRVEPAPHVERLFANGDALAALAGPGDLLDRAVALVDDAVVVARTSRGGDELSLTLSRGIPFAAELDRFTATFVSALDGRATPRDVVAALAAERGGDADRLAAAAVPVLHELVSAGFATLAPVESEAAPA